MHDRSAEIVTQWHQADTNDPRFQGSPPLAIMTQGGQWKISVRKPSWNNITDPDADNIAVGQYQTGGWTDWVVHVKWSAGADGLRRIWKDGQEVHSFSGQNKFNDGQGNYMKFGIYKWDWSQNKPSNTTQRAMYFDELRIADHRGSKATVEPDGAPPAVRGVGVESGGDRAIIEWTANKPANSQVEYTELPVGDTFETALDPDLVTYHSQVLRWLTPNTRYRFRIKSKDEAGRLGTYDGSFWNPPEVP